MHSTSHVEMENAISIIENWKIFRGFAKHSIILYITLFAFNSATPDVRKYPERPAKVLAGLPGHENIKSVDDLKVYDKNEYFLEQSFRHNSRYKNEFGMSFGFEKCAKIHLKCGNVSDVTQNKYIVNSNTIRRLNEEKVLTRWQFQYSFIPLLSKPRRVKKSRPNYKKGNYTPQKDILQRKIIL